MAEDAGATSRITYPHLERVTGLRHALTTRRSDLGRVSRALGLERLATLRQVHGADVVVLDALPPTPPAADALVLRGPGLLGGVRGADCPLLLLVDARNRALALVHSGWRGTVAGVVTRAVETLGEVVGSRPTELLVALAPGMCAACYEVGPEVVEAVCAHVPGGAAHLVPTRGGHARLDLLGAIEAQLVEAGVESSNVRAHPSCTYEDEATFFSYRREGARAGRHALLAGWCDE